MHKFCSDEKIIYFGDEDVLTRAPCLYYIIRSKLAHKEFFNMIFSLHLPLKTREKLKHILNNIYTIDLLHKRFVKKLYPSYKVKNVNHMRESQMQPYSMDLLWRCFLVLLVGYVFGGIYFIIELICLLHCVKDYVCRMVLL